MVTKTREVLASVIACVITVPGELPVVVSSLYDLSGVVFDFGSHVKYYQMQPLLEQEVSDAAYCPGTAESLEVKAGKWALKITDHSGVSLRIFKDFRERYHIMQEALDKYNRAQFEDMRLIEVDQEKASEYLAKHKQ